MTIRKYKHPLLTLLFLFTFGLSQAQKQDSLEYQSKRKLQYLDITMNDEKSKLKFSPDYYMSDHFNYLSLYLSYETKIRKQFSFSVNNSSLFDVYPKTSYVVTGSEQKSVSFYNSTGVSFRYYFTLDRRMREGVSGNNLTGLYAEVEMLNLVNLYDKGLYKDFLDKRVIDVPDPKISVGLQKRLNRWSYVDVYVSSMYYRDLLVSNIGFRIGIAL